MLFFKGIASSRTLGTYCKYRRYSAHEGCAARFGQGGGLTNKKQSGKVPFDAEKGSLSGTKRRFARRTRNSAFRSRPRERAYDRWRIYRAAAQPRCITFPRSVSYPRRSLTDVRGSSRLIVSFGCAIRSSERTEFAGRNSPGARDVVHTEIERKTEERDRCRNALFSRMCGAAIRSMDFAHE